MAPKERILLRAQEDSFCSYFNVVDANTRVSIFSAFCIRMCGGTLIVVRDRDVTKRAVSYTHLTLPTIYSV